MSEIFELKAQWVVMSLWHLLNINISPHLMCAFNNRKYLIK